MNDRIVDGVTRAASAGGFRLDPAQRALLGRLAVLGDAIDQDASPRSVHRSLYIHGAAGRGKSWLADAFFEAAPTRRKTRVHFHRFFDELHRGIHHHRGERDAVERAIHDVVDGRRLILFDELHVHDSGDARLLTRLLERVLPSGIAVLATSNYAPSDLLPDPVWHHIFEPGIALINANIDVWHLDGPTDYRTLGRDHSRGFAAGSWSMGPSASVTTEQTLTVNGREFVVTSARDGELVATFRQLCGTATSSVEYLHWVRRFPHWTITDIPCFAEVDREGQQRFVNLVDILVDADIPVTFSADVGLEDFLANAAGRPDAFRMGSRLRLLDAH